jgi:hypothetical protein
MSHHGWVHRDRQQKEKECTSFWLPKSIRKPRPKYAQESQKTMMTLDKERGNALTRGFSVKAAEVRWFGKGVKRVVHLEPKLVDSGAYAKVKEEGSMNRDPRKQSIDG